MYQGSAFLSEERNGLCSARTVGWDRFAAALVYHHITPRRALPSFLVEGLFGPVLMSLVRIHWRIFLMTVLFVPVVFRLLFFG